MIWEKNRKLIYFDLCTEKNILKAANLGVVNFLKKINKKKLIIILKAKEGGVDLSFRSDIWAACGIGD